MKNVVIGFFAGIVLLLTIGQAGKTSEYEVTTKWSSHGKFNSGNSIQLWDSPYSWKAQNGENYDTMLGLMYLEGWRVVSCQKTNEFSEEHQYFWVFERKK